ncbi:uncharacterized protein BDR25DRAFT_381393 [Lindgomyces ingoldianus]|uniref:Uncharacterized protein n=1 Tax=Lindgomyces ingoldianus TaxID=673940 RepID=A0ACB6QBJ8_9PLEO|nr:uncharacterized protein BDR25DRAFT_381393 [Lindgomyces ingoldianus]KAF2464281.1 hypothetical protein BDR25DRAFT_381393 [Lindgomyces ingoldianus]
MPGLMWLPRALAKRFGCRRLLPRPGISVFLLDALARGMTPTASDTPSLHLCFMKQKGIRRNSASPPLTPSIPRNRRRAVAVGRPAGCDRHSILEQRRKLLRWPGQTLFIEEALARRIVTMLTSPS